jgi:hypothetical protein
MRKGVSGRVVRPHRLPGRPYRNIDEAYPALAPLLATPCDFVIYQKNLAVDLGGGDDQRPAGDVVESCSCAST